MLSMKYVNIYFGINSHSYIFLYNRDCLFLAGPLGSHTQTEVAANIFLLWYTSSVTGYQKNLGKGLTSKMNTSLQLIVILENIIIFSLNANFNDYLKVWNLKNWEKWVNTFNIQYQPIGTYLINITTIPCSNLIWCYQDCTFRKAADNMFDLKLLSWFFWLPLLIAPLRHT